MKSSLAPIEIAIDAVAVFAGMLGCVLLFWAPFLLGYVFFHLTRTGTLAGLVVLLFVIEIVCAVLGMFVVWLALGLLQRRLIRTGLFVILIGFWGLFLAFSPALQRSQSSLQHFQSCLSGIVMVFAAVISACGLKKYNGSIKG